MPELAGHKTANLANLAIGEAVADNARPRVHSKAGFESVYQTGVLQLL